jgi:hypothetical protein
MGLPAIRIGGLSIDGVEQIHGTTTSILRSHVAITRYRDSIVELAMFVATKKKRPISIPRSQRRWSVDCSTYTWGQEHIADKDKTYTQNPAWEEKKTGTMYDHVHKE